MIKYRKAIMDDIEAICKFTDFWLAGRGKRVNAVGAVDDYFLSPSQHRKYVTRYFTLLAVEDVEIVGWAVLEPSRTLIGLLVSGDKRGQGIGKELVKRLNPIVVRSKSNQSSGNPKLFYEHIGFELLRSEPSRARLLSKSSPVDRPKTIDVLIKRLVDL